MRKRRRSSGAEGQDAVEAPVGEATADDAGEGTAESPARTQGPWDVSEHPVDEDDESRAHLGSLSIKGHKEVEVRLQVDEGSGQVQAVMLVTKDGALELRAFAAPRHESIWDDIRERIVAEATRRGGRAEEADGPYGTAVRLLLPAVGPDGQQVTQPSTVIGIAGPRWLLRVSMFGRPAEEWRDVGLLESVLRDVVVIRGSQPMAPGDPLPLTLPTNARRVGPRP